MCPCATKRKEDKERNKRNIDKRRKRKEDREKKKRIRCVKYLVDRNEKWYERPVETRLFMKYQQRNMKVGELIVNIT